MALAAADDSGPTNFLTGQGSAYLFDPCGNGVRTAREHCDDGNTVGGDACPATCSFCEAGPDAGCRAAGAGLSLLGLKRPGTDRDKDQLKWKWKARTGTLPADFGDPRQAEPLSRGTSMLTLHLETRSLPPQGGEGTLDVLPQPNREVVGPTTRGGSSLAAAVRAPRLPDRRD